MFNIPLPLYLALFAGRDTSGGGGGIGSGGGGDGGSGGGGSGTPIGLLLLLTSAGSGGVPAPDPAVLTAPDITSTGTTTVDLTVTTDTGTAGSDVLYVLVTTSAATPSAAQIAAGLDATNAAGAYASSWALTHSGQKFFLGVGLVASTAYYAYYVQHNVNGYSNIASAGPESTDALPQTFGMPNASTTGNHTVGLVNSGSITANVAGATIQGKNITGYIHVTADNVTIKNCVINGTQAWGIDAEGSSGLTVIDCTFIGPDATSSAILSGSDSTLIARNDIRGWENGITLQGGSHNVIGNYIHDLAAAIDGHFDGISVQGNQDGVLIEGNAVYSWDTSCVFIKADFGPITNVTVNNNWLLNQPGKATAAAIYSYSVGANLSTNITITNNKMQPGFNGNYGLLNNSSPTWTGNTDYDTNASIPSP